MRFAEWSPPVMWKSVAVPVFLFLVAGCSGDRIDEKAVPGSLLELREREGRDNALIYYVMGTQDIQFWPTGKENGLAREVLRDGWSERANDLLPFMEKCRPSLAWIRKGAALDYARYPDGDPDEEETAFYPGDVGLKVVMLCVEGRYAESQGNYAAALDEYLTALAFARDIGAPGAELIYQLISIALGGKPIGQIHRLVLSGTLDRSQLARALDRLREIDTTWGSLVDSFRVDARFEQRILERMKENPDRAANMLDFALKENQMTIADVIEDGPRLAQDMGKLWDFELAYMEEPYWERDRAEHSRRERELLQSLHPLLRQVFHEHFPEAENRYLVMRAKLRLAQAAAATALYRIDHAALPGKPADLTAYFGAPPIDPFSGGGFRRQTGEAADRVPVYSIGPDMEDNSGQLLYDASNGTFTAGDVFLR